MPLLSFDGNQRGFEFGGICMKSRTVSTPYRDMKGVLAKARTKQCKRRERDAKGKLLAVLSALAEPR